jgi:hypothetical protein
MKVSSVSPERCEQVARHLVPPVAVPELRGRRVQGDRDSVRAGPVAGVADGLHEQGENVLGFGDLGREAALVAQPDRQLAADQLGPQRRVDLGTGADRLRHRGGADRGENELLEVQLVGRMPGHMNVLLADPRRRPCQERHRHQALAGHGYAGIDNELYVDPKTAMSFADAKQGLAAIQAALKTLIA